MKPTKSYLFVYNNILYIKDGINYLEYNETTLTINPASDGTIYEDVNMLSDYRRNIFVVGGTASEKILFRCKEFKMVLKKYK